MESQGGEKNLLLIWDSDSLIGTAGAGFRSFCILESSSRVPDLLGEPQS